MNSTPQKLKVGAINYVNALPFLHNIEQHSDFEFIYGKPSTINKQLQDGTLDVALISSASYLDNRSDYLLLSPFAIACQDEILSVRLYYTGGLDSLTSITVPIYSATSTALLKILCKHVWNLNPTYIESSDSPLLLADTTHGFLTIGDECLKIKDLPNFSYIDLGRAWHELTEKPFVFAIFATRVEAFRTKKPQLKAFFRVLENQFNQFEANPEPAIQEGARRLNCSPQLIQHYFRLIDYRVSEQHFSGLERYALLR